MEPRFTWICSYMGTQEFEVRDRTGIYYVETRYEASDYERKISTYDDAAWEREVVAAIGLLRRKYDGSKPVPEETVEAFNAWRAKRYADDLAVLRANPQKYGDEASIQEMIASGLLKPPMVVRGAYFKRRSADWRDGVEWMLNDGSTVHHAGGERTSDPDFCATAEDEAAYAVQLAEEAA